jgi:subtilase family serine protease
VPVLGPGASSQGEVDVKIPSKAPLGPHFLLACADNGGDVIESNERNNCAASATPIKTDVTDALAEVSKADNEYTKTITIAP